MVAEEAKFMGSTWGAFARNFRGHDDVINAAESEVSVVVPIFASSLVMSPWSAGFFLVGTEVVRREECTVHPISTVSSLAAVVASMECSIHVSDYKWGAVFMSVKQGFDVSFHFLSACYSFICVAGWPVRSYQMQISIGSFEYDRGNFSFRVTAGREALSGYG